MIGRKCWLMTLLNFIIHLSLAQAHTSNMWGNFSGAPEQLFCPDAFRHTGLSENQSQTIKLYKQKTNDVHRRLIKRKWTTDKRYIIQNVRMHMKQLPSRQPMPHRSSAQPAAQCPVMLSQLPPCKQSQWKRQPHPKYPALQPVKTTIHPFSNSQILHLVKVLADCKLTIVNRATDQWRKWLEACVKAKGQYFKQLL